MLQEKYYGNQNGVTDDIYIEKDFTDCIMKTQKNKIERLYSGTISIPKYNYLEKYNESNKKFEDNQDYRYSYFKNNDLVLQIVTTNELEEDNELITKYAKFNEEANEYDYYRDINKIEEFYKYKREYYLVDFNNDVKTKLECNNLIYDAEAFDNGKESIEKIVLFTNGNIPFYDKTENGCFTKEGEKIDINNNYLLCDITDKYKIILDKTNSITYIVSNETNEKIKQLDGTLIKYDGFYVLYVI